MKIITRFVCEICNKEYANKIDAEVCENQGIDNMDAKVGDIVYVTAGYGWYDGDKRWVMNPDVKTDPKHGNCFGKCCTMAFYYVITAITQDPEDLHRIRYHIYTNAMTGKQGHQNGWSSVDGGYTPKVIKN